jgi:hypothetical protein
MAQQCFQGTQFGHPGDRCVDQLHATTNGSIEHPMRHFQDLVGRIVFNRTSKYDPIPPCQ